MLTTSSALVEGRFSQKFQFSDHRLRFDGDPPANHPKPLPMSSFGFGKFRSNFLVRSVNLSSVFAPDDGGHDENGPGLHII